MTHPIAGPCDSPNVVTVNKVPKVLPDIFFVLKVEESEPFYQPCTNSSEIKPSEEHGFQ